MLRRCQWFFQAIVGHWKLSATPRQQLHPKYATWTVSLTPDAEESSMSLIFTASPEDCLIPNRRLTTASSGSSLSGMGPSSQPHSSFSIVFWSTVSSISVSPEDLTDASRAVRDACAELANSFRVIFNSPV